MENNTKVIISGTAMIVMVILGMFTFQYTVDRDTTTLYRNNEIMFRARWYVHAQRTYFNANTWYDWNVRCPRIEALGGYRTATRCYYPPDYYESTSRSLINTKISQQPHELGFMIVKEVPHFAYGSRGAYAGFLREHSVFEESIDDEKNIPFDYWTDWSPRDTRNYKLQWRITHLKNINLEDGNYTYCNYEFGDVFIDIHDCDKLDRVEIDNARNRMDVWFNAERGYQNISVKLYDPIGVSLFAAVGNGGNVRWSDGGKNWTTSGTAGSSRLWGVAWSPELGLFVAVGASGNVRWSDDGKTWTTTGTAGTTTLNGIAWSAELGLFAAVGDDGNVRWSDDGKNWTTSGTAGTTTLRGVAWSAELGLFVAVGDSGAVRWSEDGKTWTTSGTAGSSRLWGVAWSAELGLFAAVGDSGAVRWSEDGKTWTTTGTAGTTTLRGVAWSAELGLFAAVGTSGAVRWSEDGKTWTTTGTAGTTTLNEVAWSAEQGLFAAVGGFGNVRWSEDGKTWTTTGTAGTTTLTAVAWGTSPPPPPPIELFLEGKKTNASYEFGTNATIEVKTTTGNTYCVYLDDVEQFCNNTNLTIDIPMDYLEYNTFNDGNTSKLMNLSQEVTLLQTNYSELSQPTTAQFLFDNITIYNASEGEDDWDLFINATLANSFLNKEATRLKFGSDGSGASSTQEDTGIYYDEVLNFSNINRFFVDWDSGLGFFFKTGHIDTSFNTNVAVITLSSPSTAVRSVLLVNVATVTGNRYITLVSTAPSNVAREIRIYTVWYEFEGDWDYSLINTSNMFDNDNATFSYPPVPSDDFYVYFNYTKQTNFSRTHSFLYVQDNLGTENITLPSSCWNHYSDKISIRTRLKTVESSNPVSGAGVEWYCYNGAWESLRDSSIGYDTVAKAYQVSLFGGIPPVNEGEHTIEMYVYNELSDNLLMFINAVTEVVGLTIEYLGNVMFDFQYPVFEDLMIVDKTSDDASLVSLNFGQAEELSLGLSFPTFAPPLETESCSINISGLEANNETFQYADRFFNASFVDDNDNPLEHYWILDDFSSDRLTWNVDYDSTETVTSNGGTLTQTLTLSKTDFDRREASSDFYGSLSTFSSNAGCNGYYDYQPQYFTEGIQTQTALVTNSIDFSLQDYMRINYYYSIYNARFQDSGCIRRSAHTHIGEVQIYLRDNLGNTVLLQQKTRILTGTTSGTKFLEMKRVSPTQYAVYEDSVFQRYAAIVSGRTYSLYIREYSRSRVSSKGSTTQTTTLRIDDVSFGGIGPEHEGGGNYTTSTYFKTKNLNNFTEPFRTVYFDADTYNPSGSTISFNISNDGTTWKTANPGFTTVFDNYGDELYVEGAVNRGTHTGFLDPHIINYAVDVQNTTPSGILIDFGGDGVYEYNFSGSLDYSNSPVQVNFTCSDMISESEQYCTATQCTSIPIIIFSNTPGILEVDDIQFKVNISELSVDKTFFEDDITDNPSNITFVFNAESGILNLTGFSFPYIGNGIKQLRIEEGANTETTNITIRYSPYDLYMPVDFLEFMPSRPTSKRVQPYGQNVATPIFNFTANQGIDNMSLTMLVDGELACVDMFYGISGNVSEALPITSYTWNNLFNDKPTGYMQPVWLWLNLSCSFNQWTLFNPDFHFRGCAMGAKCSEEYP